MSNNLFDFTPSDIGADCVSSNMCGYNGLFSETGYHAVLDPQRGLAFGSLLPLRRLHGAQQHLQPSEQPLRQQRVLRRRRGASWQFVGFAQGNNLSQSQWTSGEANAAASGDTFNGQDSGSTFSSSACLPKR